NLDPKGVNRVVLMSDGVPNVEATIRDQARAAGGRGISITSLGLGPDYDETLMGAVAQLSGGRFRYVDDSSKVAAFFNEEVLRLRRVFARSAALELTPGPGVRIEEVVGQSWAAGGNGTARVSVGDFGPNDSYELFVVLSTSPRRDTAPVELLDAALTF